MQQEFQEQLKASKQEYEELKAEKVAAISKAEAAVAEAKTQVAALEGKMKEQPPAPQLSSAVFDKAAAALETNAAKVKTWPVDRMVLRMVEMLETKQGESCHTAVPSLSTVSYPHLAALPL